MACDEATKATAIIKHKGKEIKIESKHPGVTYTNESSYDVNGNDKICEYKLITYRPNGTIGIEIFKINPSKNVYVQTPAMGGLDFGFPAFVLWADQDRLSAKYQGFEAIDMVVEFNGNCLGTGYLVEIFDKRGRIFRKFFPGEQPEVNIICDDACPPNHLKCKCDKYPGFCCVPCNQINSQITKATSTLKGIKS